MKHWVPVAWGYCPRLANTCLNLTKRLIEHPVNEHGLCFSHNGYSLINLIHDTTYLDAKQQLILSLMLTSNAIIYKTISHKWTTSFLLHVTGFFVRRIHRWSVDSPHNGQWHRTLVCSLICAWTNGRANNWDAGDSRRHHAHYDVTVMIRVDANVILLNIWK